MNLKSKCYFNLEMGLALSVAMAWAVGVAVVGVQLFDVEQLLLEHYPQHSGCSHR